MKAPTRVGIDIKGNLVNPTGATKRNLAGDMNQGLKNPHHYVDGVSIGDGTTDARAAILLADAGCGASRPSSTHLTPRPT